MRRRDFCGALLVTPAAAQQYAARTRALPPITIRAARVITTSPQGRYQWAFLKLETSEPGLYGIGSASNLFHCAAIATAMVPFLLAAILFSYFGLQRRAWQQGGSDK